MQYQEVISKLNNYTEQEDLKEVFDDIYKMCQSQRFTLDEIMEVVGRTLKMDMMRFSNELKKKCWEALESARLNYHIYAYFDWRPLMQAKVAVEYDIEAYVDQCISTLVVPAGEVPLSRAI